MPVNSSLVYYGLAKETTQGTAVAASVFLPVADTIDFADDPGYVEDKALRGAMGMRFGMYQDFITSKGSVGGDAYPDTIGHYLMSVLGVDTVTGIGPYVHTLTLPNAQPPSYTHSEYDGIAWRQYPGCMTEELTLELKDKGTLKFTAKVQGWKSAGITKAAATYTTTVPFMVWQGVVTLGGVANARVISMTYTIKRTLQIIEGVHGNQNPHAIFASALDVDGKMTLVPDDDTEFGDFIGNTQQALSVTLTQGANVLTLQTTLMGMHGYKPSFSKAAVERDFDLWMLANATDAGASGPNSPIKAILTNGIATPY